MADSHLRRAPTGGEGRRIVVVTGASTGVVRATARAFAREGASFALLARGIEGLSAAAREIEAEGGRALVVPTDVANPPQVDRAAERSREELGVPDVGVNNAMTAIFAEFGEIRTEEFRRVTQVAYLGSVYGTMAALRLMIPFDRGAIVQVGSALAYRSIPVQSAHCGAKHALRGFTDAVRCELLHRRSAVTLTRVHLRGLNTPQFSWRRTRRPRQPQPVPPIFQPERAAAAIVRARGTARGRCSSPARRAGPCGRIGSFPRSSIGTSDARGTRSRWPTRRFPSTARTISSHRSRGRWGPAASSMRGPNRRAIDERGSRGPGKG